MKTAEEFYNEAIVAYESAYPDFSELNGWQIEQLMIRFAQYHVREALKNANETVKEEFAYDMGDIILNSYPEENIK